MAVPDFQSLMLPALQALADGAATPISRVRARVAATENLTEDDLRELVPSGRQAVFVNRVSWALSYMEPASLVERVRRGVYRLALEGERLLKQNPERIDLQVLSRYPGYREWKAASTPKPRQKDFPVMPGETLDTPEEALEHAAQQLRRELEIDLLRHPRRS